MNTKNVALASCVAAIAVTVAIIGALALSSSASSPSPNTTTNATTNTLPFPSWAPNGSGQFLGQTESRPPSFQGSSPMMGCFRGTEANLSVGQTITITSTNGRYFITSSPDQNGTASANFTFTVTGKFESGYALSLTSGTITFNGTAYTISSGTARTGPNAINIVGQGTTTSGAQFMLQSHAEGSFVGTTSMTTLDFKTGTIEYQIQLSGTA